MTICISAICNGGNSVIVASDKMITYTYPPYHQFEHPKPKIHKISNKIVLMSAGSALLPSEFLEILQEKIEKVRVPPSSVRKVANIAVDTYKLVRINTIENRILSKYGIQWSEYKQFLSSGKMPEVFYRIVGQVEEFRLELDVIIAGVDNSGAHIYVIDNPGDISSFDDIGYTAIGSGSYHAIRSFIENNYSIDLPLNIATYVVYEAKKYAECAPGVGKQTELVIINESGIYIVKEELMQTLDNIYESKIKKINNLRKEVIAEIQKNIKLCNLHEDNNL